MKLNKAISVDSDSDQSRLWNAQLKRMHVGLGPPNLVADYDRAQLTMRHEMSKAWWDSRVRLLSSDARRSQR